MQKALALASRCSGIKESYLEASYRKQCRAEMDPGHVFFEDPEPDSDEEQEQMPGNVGEKGFEDYIAQAGLGGPGV